MKACKDCKGRGRYQVKEVFSDGEEMLTWYECNTCKGTGTDQEAEAGNDYDVAGDSYEDDEQDDEKDKNLRRLI